MKSIWKSILLCLPFGLGMIQTAHSQSDATLFTVGNTPVSVAEFRYIYAKTNGAKATYGEASLREYLDLYTKFKLKVARARDMRLDTVPALRDELDGYRSQLAKSYLIDRTLVEQLAREAYDRSKQDVFISHILATFPANPTPADTLSAYRKAQAAMNRLKANEAYEKVAKDGSDDAGTRDNGGKIGWFTALQLPGFYNLETAAYTVPVGSYSEIVRSPLGYHIIKVNERRRAYGEVKVAHVLMRIKKDATQGQKDSALLKINQIYTRLSQEKFEDLARIESEDKVTSSKGGEIGWFTINKYEPAFEDAAFTVSKNGDYSKPFQSSLGWHIIKRLDRKENVPYEDMKNELMGKIKRDSRFDRAQEAMVTRIKAEAGFTEATAVKDAFVKGLGKDFLGYQWKPEIKDEDRTKNVFTVGTKSAKVSELTTYMERSASGRARRGAEANINEVFNELYGKFVQTKALEYEETQLGKKYPEFRSLMREYEEGILLFEATKRMVWDKASEDSSGLKRFYEDGKSKYMWGQRVRTVKYNVNSSDEKLLAKVNKSAMKNDPKAMLKKFNKKGALTVITYEEAIVEKGKNPVVDALKWEKNTQSAWTKVAETNSFTQITDVVAPTIKTLKEARGYVVADYQEFLERKWLEDLRKAYPVKNEDAAFNGLIGNK